MDAATQRYGHAPVSMKRVVDRDDVDNVGEFAWSDESGYRFITIALPRPRPEAPDDYIMNHLPIEPGTGVHGRAWGWDGNEDMPTLTPSIHCIGHWHGWVCSGTLVEA